MKYQQRYLNDYLTAHRFYPEAEAPTKVISRELFLIDFSHVSLPFSKTKKPILTVY
jgi:hypothetical protein